MSAAKASNVLLDSEARSVLWREIREASVQVHRVILRDWGDFSEHGTFNYESWMPPVWRLEPGYQ